MIALIVARARNGAIGRNGTIPWHAPEDLAHFKRATEGAALVMGRRTWESLPRRPLPGRLNIVVSSDPDVAEVTARSVAEALTRARDAGHDRVFGIGGAAIYAEMLPLADRLLVTEVDLDVPDADTVFPMLDPAIWAPGQRTVLREADPTCVLQAYERRG